MFVEGCRVSEGIERIGRGANEIQLKCIRPSTQVKAGPPPPLEAILVIFGHRALIFFCLKGLGKK